MEYCSQHDGVMEMKKQVSDIHTALLGDLNNGNEGIKYKVIRHDKYLKGFDKLKWIVITAFIGVVILSIWGLVI